MLCSEEMQEGYGGGGGWYSHIVLGGCVPLGSRKSYPLLDQLLQVL